MDYIQITIEVSTQYQSEQFVAELSEIGFDGFEEEENILKAFVPETGFNEDLFENFIKLNSIKYYKSIIKEKNWNENWESGFQPVMVYDSQSKKPLVHIRAQFHQEDPSIPYDLVITPKMSFGTGHHATTYLMIEQMLHLDIKDKTVVDFGTGTGILAIFAEKLGAVSILGIDHDDWCIENANENIVANGCKKIKILKETDCSKIEVKADILLANINLNVIKENLTFIKTFCRNGATLLFSGILECDMDEIKSALHNAGFEINKIFMKEGWLLIKSSF